MEDSIAATLQTRITQLEQECATLRAEAKDRRIKGKTLRDENETLKTQVATLTTERDTLVTAAKAQPDELQAKVEEYRGKLRDRDHRDKFRELARKAGVTDDKALGDLYQLSGYKPETDDIDEGKITAAISQALQGRDWLKSPTQAAGAAAPAAGAANGQPAGAGQSNPPLQPGPGASRGGASVRDDTDGVLETKYPNAFRLA